MLTPSVTASWKPDFSKPVFGTDLNYFQEDVNGELFDRFTRADAWEVYPDVVPTLEDVFIRAIRTADAGRAA